MEIAAAQTTKNAKTKRRFLPVSLALALTVAYAVIATTLITLRAVVDELAFLSTGWIVLLAVVPLVPWLVPALAPAVQRIAPFVKQIKLPGGIEISLSSAERPVAGLGTVETALTSDHLVHGLAANASPFMLTDAMTVIKGVQSMRKANAEAVVVDLAWGAKWRLPNLYFLAWILANDPLTRWLVFTEARGQTSGYFVGVSAAAELRARIETVYPEYATAGQQLEFYDPTQLQNPQQLANEFNKIRSAVAPPNAGDVPTLAWVTTADLRDLLGPRLAATSIRWSGELDRAALEAIVRSPEPYVAATTADGKFRGLIEQRIVVLEFARRVLESN